MELVTHFLNLSLVSSVYGHGRRPADGHFPLTQDFGDARLAGRRRYQMRQKSFPILRPHVSCVAAAGRKYKFSQLTNCFVQSKINEVTVARPLNELRQLPY